MCLERVERMLEWIFAAVLLADGLAAAVLLMVLLGRRSPHSDGRQAATDAQGRRADVDIGPYGPEAAKPEGEEHRFRLDDARMQEGIANLLSYDISIKREAERE